MIYDKMEFKKIQVFFKTWPKDIKNIESLLHVYIKEESLSKWLVNCNI